MKTKFLMTASVIAAGLLAAACTTDDQASADTAATADQTAAYDADQTDAQGVESGGATAPSSPSAASADFTGQTVYDESGVEVGTVAGVGTASATGQQVAIISVGNYLGMGAKNIAIPQSELSARAEGGLTVSMSSDELQAAPEYTGPVPSAADPAEPVDEPQSQP